MKFLTKNFLIPNSQKKKKKKKKLILYFEVYRKKFQSLKFGQEKFWTRKFEKAPFSEAPFATGRGRRVERANILNIFFFKFHIF